MALLINDLCINCDVCAPACPNQAIAMGAEIYEIDPGRCTECKGHHAEPQCQLVCPVECILQDPERCESEEELMARYRQLTGATA